MRNYYTCTRCGETWECRMKAPPVPCGGAIKVGMCVGEVRAATPDEIELYEKMFVDW